MVDSNTDNQEKKHSFASLCGKFYLSDDYNPKAERPADNVQAAIAFTLKTINSSDFAEKAADAVADALASVHVAYSHDTLADMSTANRSWKVHNVDLDNPKADPFEKNEWLGEFDNKEEARNLTQKLRRERAVAALQEILTKEFQS